MSQIILTILLFFWIIYRHCHWELTMQKANSVIQVQGKWPVSWVLLSYTKVSVCYFTPVGRNTRSVSRSVSLLLVVLQNVKQPYIWTHTSNSSSSYCNYLAGCLWHDSAVSTHPPHTPHISLPPSFCCLLWVIQPAMQTAVSLEGYPVLLWIPLLWKQSDIGQKGRPDYTISVFITLNGWAISTTGLAVLTGIAQLTRVVNILLHHAVCMGDCSSHDL